MKLHSLHPVGKTDNTAMMLPK